MIVIKTTAEHYIVNVTASGTLLTVIKDRRIEHAKKYEDVATAQNDANFLNRIGVEALVEDRP